MADNNKLELVVEVDVNKANASIKSINTGLSSMEQAAGKAARGASGFIDTEYNGESFFVRHAYFTGADQPYEKLQRALKADVDEAAWSAIYSTTSRPFPKPKTACSPYCFRTTDMLPLLNRAAAWRLMAKASTAQIAALSWLAASAVAKKAATYGDLLKSRRRVSAP
jgi:hypothetical protein